MKVARMLAEMVASMREKSHSKNMVVIGESGLVEILSAENRCERRRYTSLPSSELEDGDKLSVLKSVLSGDYSHLVHEPRNGNILGVPLSEVPGMNGVAVVDLDLGLVEYIPEVAWDKILGRLGGSLRAEVPDKPKPPRDRFVVEDKLPTGDPTVDISTVKKTQ